MRFGIRQVVVLLLTATAGTMALAFNFIGSRWVMPTATIHIGVSGTSPSGVAWATALQEATQVWNDKTDFTFTADPSYVDPCSQQDGINGVDFKAKMCGNNFGSGTLAVTLTQANPGQLGFGLYFETDIIFNTAYSWDVYDGPRRSRVDFRRVAVHELGHALGLDHETGESAIMAPNITDTYTLQPDDIAGVSALYNGNNTCLVRDIASNAVINDRLDTGDCRVRDLFGGSDDTSFVDVYRLRLLKTTEIDLVMRSSELDSVLILARADLSGIEIYDDFAGQCDAHVTKVLPAGEYRIMANTYVTPAKCAGNIGGYNLTLLSDSDMPLLGTVKSASGGSVANAVITGGATANGGTSFGTTFSASQPIDVLAQIVPDPLHVGLSGHVFVLAVLSDGRQFMKNSSGQFVRFNGGLGNLVPLRSGTLAAVEPISVASGLQGSALGLAGQTITVYVGYSLNVSPQQIWYGGTPIQFTITP